MPRSDTHSRVVGWLKVVLPLLALVLLSTLFLLSDRIDPEDAIPYAEVDVEALALDPRMTAPIYAGITEDGTAITVTAKEARPSSDEEAADAVGIQARLEMPGGGSAEIDAAEARVDNAAGNLRLSGGVTLKSSAGYTVTTDALTARLDRSGAESTGAVQAEGPAGVLTAGKFSMQFEQGADQEAGRTYLLVFTDRVKLVYQPGG
jgi:lipopolysaccharide export system protein LptC